MADTTPETPMPSTLCAVCAKPARLIGWSARSVGVPRRDAIEAVYHCESAHEMRVEVRHLPGFGGAA